MDRETLLKLIQDDDLGILDVKHQLPEAQNHDSRFIASFQEINDYIRETGHEPQANSQDMREFGLYSRLNHIRDDKEKINIIQKYDEFHLLSAKKDVAALFTSSAKCSIISNDLTEKTTSVANSSSMNRELTDKVNGNIISLEDIFADDDMAILKDLSDSIFDIQHIPRELTIPDYVAQRKPCQNFSDYEQLFKECHTDLGTKRRKLMPFAKEQQIDEGDFFVLKGILTYIAFVGEKEINNGKKNARLLCIFENGTESDMLLRSLARELYKDGRRVTFRNDQLLNEFKGVTKEDKETGWIYILKSHCKERKIQSIEHLYKIGFSCTPVEERIKYAAREPTYLMAPVSLIASYQCFNLDPQKFELLLHKFFAAACLNLDVFDQNGQRHTPREWFVVPIWTINRAIELLMNGEIINFRYDHDQQEIVEKK